MSYSSVWLIIIATGCLAIVPVYMLIRRVMSGFLCALVCALILAVLLTPAPVPEHPQSYAPAFIVAVFEGVFQARGNPAVALRLLLAGITVAIALVVLGAIGLRRWKRRAGAAEPLAAAAGGDE